MDWPPKHNTRSTYKRPSQPPQARFRPGPSRPARPVASPPPDLTSPILLLLGLAFVLAYFYSFGLPIEIEFILRRLNRRIRRMGLISWWRGGGGQDGGQGGGNVELEGTPRPRRRRGGDLNTTASSVAPPLDPSSATDGHFPGLVNSSGAFCFLNSVLQAMAALPPFLAYIAHLYSQALTYDVPSPLLDVLIPLLSALSTPSPKSYPRPLRLTALIEALTLAPIFKSSGMFNRMREQQDAQELWQLLVSAVEEEGEVIKKIGIKEGREGFRGLMSLVADKDEDPTADESPFKGRLAYRRGCRICGYSEGIRLTAFDNLQLSVPRQLSTPLTSLLDSYTSLDILTDAQCRKCRILQTLRTLERNLPSPPSQEDATGEPVSASKKKRLREARREYEREVQLVEEVRKLVTEQRCEEEVEGVKWELVDGGISTRQDMFSLPPPILALHLNRSSYSSHYASKNPCRILFPSLLDLTPFCTTGTLSLSPSSSISTPPPPPPSIASFLSASSSPFTVVGPNGTTAIETPSPPSTSPPANPPAQTIYRLSSAIYHLGNHNAGHYITYRRVKGTERWLRVSDEDVEEVREGVEGVRASRGEVFMLFYELLLDERESAVGKARVVRSVGLQQGAGSGSSSTSGGGSALASSPPTSPSPSSLPELPVAQSPPADFEGESKEAAEDASPSVKKATPKKKKRKKKATSGNPPQDDG